MHINIYKMSDGLWHLWRNRTSETECGLNMEQVLESKICSRKGSECFPDPPKHELCRECFKVLNFS
jgi:hypothetical protein